MAKSYEDIAALTLADMIELDACYIGVIDQMSSAHNMLSAGFTDGPIDGETKA